MITRDKLFLESLLYPLGVKRYNDQRIVISSIKSSWRSVITVEIHGFVIESVWFNIFIKDFSDGTECILRFAYEE